MPIDQKELLAYARWYRPQKEYLEEPSKKKKTTEKIAMKTPIVIMEKVAISEQRVLDAIGKRMDSIAALPKDQQPEKAFKTYWQMIGMRGDNMFNPSAPPQALSRVLGRDKMQDVIHESPIGDMGARESARIEANVSQNIFDGNYDEAGRQQSNFERTAFKSKLDDGWGNFYKENYPLGSDEAANRLNDSKRNLDRLGNPEAIDPEDVSKYKKRFNMGAKQKAPNAFMQAIKKHPYRAAAIGAAGLGIAGAGLYAATRKKDSEELTKGASMITPIVIMEKVAISEQAVLHAIESRMKDIYTTKDDKEMGRKIYETQDQLRRMTPFSHPDRRDQSLTRVLGKEKAYGINSLPSSWTYPRNRYEAGARQGIISAAESGDYEQAGRLRAKLDRRHYDLWKGSESNNAKRHAKYYKDMPSHLGADRLEMEAARKYSKPYRPKAGKIKETDISDYMHRIDPDYETTPVPKAPNIFMQAIKNHPYRAAAIGAAGLGLAGAGIYAATRKKDSEELTKGASMKTPIVIMEKVASIGSFANKWWGNVSGKTLANATKATQSAKKEFGKARDLREYVEGRLHTAANTARKYRNKVSETRDFLKDEPDEEYQKFFERGIDQFTNKARSATGHANRYEKLLASDGKLSTRMRSSAKAVSDALDAEGNASMDQTKYRLGTGVAAGGLGLAGAGLYAATRKKDDKDITKGASMTTPIVIMKMAEVQLPAEEVNAMIKQEEKDTKREWATRGALRGAGQGAIGGAAYGATLGLIKTPVGGGSKPAIKGAIGGAVLGALANAAYGAYNGYNDAKAAFPKAE